MGTSWPVAQIRSLIGRGSGARTSEEEKNHRRRIEKMYHVQSRVRTGLHRIIMVASLFPGGILMRTEPIGVALTLELSIGASVVEDHSLRDERKTICRHY